MKIQSIICENLFIKKIGISKFHFFFILLLTGFCLQNCAAPKDSHIAVDLFPKGTFNEQINLEDFAFDLRVRETKGNCKADDIVIDVALNYCEFDLSDEGSITSRTCASGVTIEYRFDGLSAGNQKEKEVTIKKYSGPGILYDIKPSQVSWAATGACANTNCRNSWFQDNLWGVLEGNCSRTESIN